jgi:hypothetical protein
MNHITGFRDDKTEALPLTTTGFESLKKKCALVAFNSKREYDILTGYVATRMVRPKSLRKIVDFTQPVMT